MEKREQDMRDRHIEFIEKDTEQRGEVITSGIWFVGVLYQCKIKKDGKSKTVNYSAAQNVIKGYRAINPLP